MSGELGPSPGGGGTGPRGASCSLGSRHLIGRWRAAERIDRSQHGHMPLAPILAGADRHHATRAHHGGGEMKSRRAYSVVASVAAVESLGVVGMASAASGVPQLRRNPY